MAAVAKRLAHLTRHRANDGSELSSNPLRHRFDTVAVHLLQAPKHPVRGFEHALERVAATVLAPQGRLLLFDPAARVVDHRQLPSLPYRLREAGSRISSNGSNGCSGPSTPGA